MNRVLIFILLVGLLYTVYRYQDIIFDQIKSTKEHFAPKAIEPPPVNVPKEKEPAKKSEKKRKSSRVNADNISQLSLESFDSGSDTRVSVLGSLVNDNDSHMSGSLFR